MSVKWLEHMSQSTPHLTSAMEMAGKTARADIDVHQVRWVAEGFQRWLRAEGTIHLEKCLRLPTTPAQIARLKRNTWIIRARDALREVPAPGPEAVPSSTLSSTSTWPTAVVLARELDKFLERGGWTQWKHLPHPPAEASQLRRCLFYVAKHNVGRPMGTHQIDRVLKHFLALDLRWLAADT